MESKSNAEMAAELMASAEHAAAGMRAKLVVPKYYDEIISVGLAGYIFSVFLFRRLHATGDSIYLWLALLGVLGIVVALVSQLHRFKRLNGVWLQGFRRGKTFWVAIATILIMLPWIWLVDFAGGQPNWWLGMAAAVGAGSCFYLGSKYWMKVYLAESKDWLNE